MTHRAQRYVCLPNKKKHYYLISLSPDFIDRRSLTAHA